MRLPYLRAGSRATALTDRIGGLCLTEEYRNGQMEWGCGLSTDESPGLGCRRLPKTVGQYAGGQALAAGDGLLVIAGGRVFYEGAELGAVTPGAKQTAVLGGRILIFPDKKYVDTAKGALYDMEASVTLTGAVFTEGTVSASGVDWPFAAGDGLTIEGCTVLPQNDQTLVLRNMDDGSLYFDEGVFEIGAEPGSITVRRRIPDLEVVCESGNRLWGCAGNTIYASKLGDPLNFFVYDGLSTDSYAVEVSGDGAFTACAPYASHILFFKEDAAHKLYGTRPANYQLMTVRIPGVRRGCAGTLWTDSEDLYYLGRMGLYAYSGGVPQLLSAGLGEIGGEAACGCVWKGRYYLSAVVGGRQSICTYDISRRVWLPWSMEQAAAFALRDGALYALMTDGRLLTLEGGEGQDDWEAVFRPFRDDTGRNSRCTSLAIDASPDPGAWFAVEIRQDGGVWQRVALFSSAGQGLRPILLPPNRGNRLQIRLVGHGPCRIRSVERRFRIGSEIT